ncbi:hypothetical protein I543_2757 [Mycobacteroides abscessus 21]|uniref:Uncharacterized protein n=1 Tax=Mycobacteroides abscessus 21 TaxID=1299324 RepID=A0A829Q4V8_9MYCO|nr:hypothetical protein I543_2757 [Mycobacteroides abscessus 21]
MTGSRRAGVSNAVPGREAVVRSLGKVAPMVVPILPARELVQIVTAGRADRSAMAVAGALARGCQVVDENC